MAYNYDYSNKMAEAYRQDLLREAEQQRLVAQLNRHRSVTTSNECRLKDGLTNKISIIDQTQTY